MPIEPAISWVLLIDDDPVTRDLIAEVLSFVIKVKTLSVSAWDLGIDKALDKRFSLIIINLFFGASKESFYPYLEDIQREIIGMKTCRREIDRDRKNGFSLSCSIKDTLCPVPILGIGPMDTPYLNDLARKAGCDMYLGKPFTVQELVEKVRFLMGSAKLKR